MPHMAGRRGYDTMIPCLLFDDAVVVMFWIPPPSSLFYTILKLIKCQQGEVVSRSVGYIMSSDEGKSRVRRMQFDAVETFSSGGGQYFLQAV